MNSGCQEYSILQLLLSFRQHLKIKHGLNASEEKGQEIRDYGKALQCQYLHGQEVHSDCAFETDSDEV